MNRKISNRQIAELYYKGKIEYARGAMAVKSYRSTSDHIRDFKDGICAAYVRDGNLYKLKNKGLADCTLNDLEGLLEEKMGIVLKPFTKKENLEKTKVHPFFILLGKRMLQMGKRG